MRAWKKGPQRPARPASRQATPEELVADLMDFLRRKFYAAGEWVTFQKESKHLKAWVVLEPAKWLDDQGLSIPVDDYRSLFLNVMQDALSHGNLGEITYRPAWLRRVIQSHLAHHGDAIREKAKSLRTLAEHQILSLGRIAQNAAPDPVRTLAAAARLLERKPRVEKAPARDQLSLL